MKLTVSVLCLALASCGPAPVGRLNPGAPFPYTIVNDHQMAQAKDASGANVRLVSSGLYPAGGHDEFGGSGWITSGLTTSHGILELHAGGTRWIAAHEACHLGDRMGSMRAAILSLTPPGEPNEDMAERLASMWSVCLEAEKRGVDPWRIIWERWGDEGVVHQTILDRLWAEGRQ